MSLWNVQRAAELGADNCAENERLPNDLGWTKKTDEVTLENILVVSDVIRNATNLLTGGNKTAAAPHRRRDLHSGMF